MRGSKEAQNKADKAYRRRQITKDEQALGEGEREWGVGRGKWTGISDPLAVSTEALAGVLKEWEKKYVASIPQEHSSFVTKANGKQSDSLSTNSVDLIFPYGPHTYLADQMQTEQNMESRLRMIQRIKRLETRWTSFYIADLLLTAMGYSISMFPDLKVVGNPRWTRERWEAWKATQGGCDTDWAGLS